MKKLFTLNSILYISLLIVLMQAQMIQAQWSNDPNVNNCVTNADKTQEGSRIVNDGQGNLIIGWNDSRASTDQYNTSLIYTQKYSPDGIAQWADNGINFLSSNNGKYLLYRIIKSENGKVIFGYSNFAYKDNFLSFSYIDVSKQDENGVMLWTKNVFSNPISSISPVSFFSDHSYGVVIVADSREYLQDDFDIIAQRVNSTGVLKWGLQGIKICSANSNQTTPKSMVNSDGYIFFVWQDYRTDSMWGDIYAQKVDSSGAIKWTNDGIAVCANSNGQGYPQIVTDNNGGIFVTWLDYIPFNKSTLRMQHINKNGDLLLDSNGILICDTTINGVPSFISDNAGGAIIVWPDNRNADDDIYAQRINADGSTQWTNGGMPVSTALGNQSNPMAIPDGNGGIIITWADYRNDVFFSDIYAQRLNHAGTPLWTTNGVAISTAPGNQSSPAIATDGNEGAVISWTDDRNGSGNYDIYAQKIDKNGNLGSVANLIRPVGETSSPVNIYPNPMKDNLYLKLNNSPDDKVIICLYSIDGTLVKEAKYGNKKLITIPVSGLKKGIYMLEVKGRNINYYTKILKQ